MTYNSAAGLELDRIADVISNLEGQIQDLKARLEVVEAAKQSDVIEQTTSPDGEARFLGRGYSIRSTQFEVTETSNRGAFLGRKYPVATAKVELAEDGTTRTFLGRKFAGMTVK